MIKKITTLVTTLFSVIFLNTISFAADATVEMLNKQEKEIMVFSQKIVKINVGDKVFWKHPEQTENKYEEWCAQVPTKSENKIGMLSKEGWVRIVKNNKATCLTKKINYHNTTVVVTNAVSVSDFAKLTRHIEWYSTSTGSKKNIRDLTCEKRND